MTPHDNVRNALTNLWIAYNELKSTKGSVALTPIDQKIVNLIGKQILNNKLREMKTCSSNSQ